MSSAFVPFSILASDAYGNEYVQTVNAATSELAGEFFLSQFDDDELTIMSVIRED